MDTNELDQIKAQLAHLEKNFNKEINFLRARVSEMERQLENQVAENKDIKLMIPSIEAPVTTEKIPTLAELLKTFQEKEKNKVAIKDTNQHSKQNVNEEKNYTSSSVKDHQKDTDKENQKLEFPPFLTDLFLPLAQFRTMLEDTYMHYKAQNRLPVFFMTLGGVMALLLGFSYLMQFVPDVYFEIFKIAGSFLASFGILFGGLVLHRKEEKYHEFGSALLGLSIAVNFLILYYLSDSTIFPIFANSIVSFALILLNTVFAKWLALRYETKVVLTISLLGGVFSPFYLNTSTIPVFYFAYLWLLCVASIYIASKIKWQIAEFLTFITASVALEIALNMSNNSLPIAVYTLIISVFAYLFFYVSLFENRIPKENLDKASIGILAGAGSLLLLNLFWLYEPVGLRVRLGLVYLANATVFIGVYFILRKQLMPKMQVLFFILIGTFVGLAIPALLERNLKGIFWAIEAIALIFCGFNFGLSGVRKEGYFVLFIAFAQIFISFGEIIDNWGIKLWTDGFINLLSLGTILGVLKLMFNHYQSIGSEDTDHSESFLEKNVSYWLSEALPLWLGFAIWIPCFFLFRELTFNLAILGLHGFTWWGLKNKLAVTEWFGILHIGLMVLGIRESILLVNSIIFPMQTMLGKGAIIEVFLSLWILQFFYEKVAPQSQNIWLMKILREIFYLLLPLLHLSYINRVYPDYLPVAIWGSVLYGFVLNQFVQRTALLVEIHIVTLFATSLLFTALGSLQIGYLSASSGILILFGILFYKKGFRLNIAQTSAYRLLFTCSFYFLGLCLWLFYTVLTSSNFVSVPDVAGMCFVVGAYFLLLTYFKDQIAPLHNNYIFAYRLGMISGLIGLVIAFIDKELVLDLYVSDFENLSFVLMLGMVILFGFIVYQKETHYPSKNAFLWILDLFCVHIFIALAYSSLIGYFTPSWTGVWLTVVLIFHAIVLLFNSNSTTYKPLLRFSLAYFAVAFAKLFWKDMAGFETVQKVVVFMVIGVLMLVGSYLFTRFREKK
jgi:hypothetical protein